MRQPLKPFQGTGKLFQNDLEIADVKYHIQRWENTKTVSSISDSQVERMGIDAQGSIVVQSPDKFLPIGETLLLVLQDGRCCHAFLSTRSMGSGQFDLHFEQLSELE